MKQLLSFLLIITIPAILFGQDEIEKQTNPIVDEGKRLYRSEMASWYGTDIFLENFKDRTKIGGYFSYSESENISKCIFFSKEEKPKVIGTISFDSTYNTKTAKADLSERDFTTLEFDLYKIRTVALKTIKTDTIFKTYQNTNLNLIPIISNEEKKVYVLTGPEQNRVIIFGNDYLLTFDKENNLTKSKSLHRNIIVTNYNQMTDKGSEVIGGMHTHLPETGDFITATDICTLMLYSKFAKWKQYTIYSKNYFSIWNCDKNTLVTITQEAMDKIYKDKKKEKE